MHHVLISQGHTVNENTILEIETTAFVSNSKLGMG